MQWKIKPFEELSTSELYDILMQRCDIFVVEQSCPYPEVDGADRQAWQLFGCDEEGRIAASMRILKPGVTYDSLAMGRVAVASECRGHGYAREMMERAIYFALNVLGEDTIKIGAQDYLTGFYESLGFRRISEVYLEDGIPHVDMVYIKKEN